MCDQRKGSKSARIFTEVQPKDGEFCGNSTNFIISIFGFLDPAPLIIYQITGLIFTHSYL